MSRRKGPMPAQPADRAADSMPCCITLVPAPATHVQRQAWACLWRMLLMADVEDTGRPAETCEGEHRE